MNAIKSRKTNSHDAPTAFAPRSWLEGGVAVLNSTEKITDINEPLCNWLELPRAELLGHSFWKLLAKRMPHWTDALRAVEKAKAIERLELKIPAANGQSAQRFALETARSAESCFVRLSSILPPRAELEESMWNEFLQSDSARCELFMRLLRAEAQLDSLMRRWPCVIFSQRPDFSFQFASSNVEEFTGISGAEWQGSSRHFWQIIHEADAAHLQRQFKEAAQNGAAITNTYRIRHRVSGRVFYILEHRQPTISQNGLLLGYEVIWLDVTRQTIAEKRLSTAAWKETLAVLTLGMAHDFRNMMAGIHSLSESFLQDVDGKHPFHEGLALIKKNSQHASQLVHGIINLHLGETGERHYHDLNEVAKELTELIGKVFPRRIEVVTKLATGSLPIYADLVEFRQVIINLFLNAADAMPQGGTLTVRTSRHLELPPLQNAKGTPPRLPCVCLSIEDQGHGINARHLASIFDPFFTTKPKGSGLGLYNARLAIEKAKGAVSVESVGGAGTSFHIWLPEADFSEMASTETATDCDTRKSLLLFGQPSEMLDKTAEFLRSHNYHVAIAHSIGTVSELMASGDYPFAGMLLLADANDRAFNASLEDVFRHGKELKKILKLTGCNPDDLDSQLLEEADMLVNSDVPETDLLNRLQRLFA